VSPPPSAPIQILLREGACTPACRTPGDVDPDEFIQTEGADAYRARVASAPRYFHWLRDRIRGRFDLRRPRAKPRPSASCSRPFACCPTNPSAPPWPPELAHDLSIDKAFLLEQVKAPAPAAARRAQSRAAPNERVLLHHLLHSSDDARQEAPSSPAEFMDRPGCDRIASHAILLTLTHLGPDFAYESLQDRLSDRDKSLLASLVFADESSKVSEAADKNSVAQVLECLDRLEQDLDRLAIDELKARIRAAEESGQMELALQLSQELQNLTRRDARRRSRPAG
jgi:DNA primase